MYNIVINSHSTDVDLRPVKVCKDIGGYIVLYWEFTLDLPKVSCSLVGEIHECIFRNLRSSSNLNVRNWLNLTINLAY